MNRWIFLDVGNILLDEDPLAYHVFRIHWEAVREVRPDVSFLGLLAGRERHAARGSRWPLYEAVSTVLDDAACSRAWQAAEREVRARFEELSPAIEGAAALVERLAGRFRLGLIANQGTECRRALERLGLLARFEVLALSEELGAFKPDPRLFRAAIDAAGVPPGHCTMIGDRLDNDIQPAAWLGMATVWVRWPRRADKGWRPSDPDGLAFRDSLERSSFLAPALFPQAAPTWTVDRLDEID